MRVGLLGCRGSFPATGAAFSRYGGDTAAVAIARDGKDPSLLLDAGTGLRNLERSRPFHGTVLLTHWHWDHTHGIPFATQLDHPEARVTLVAPTEGIPVRSVLRQILGPPHFPIGPGGLRGAWEFEATERLSRREGFEILALPVPHKGGLTLGYRVEADGQAIAYLPDHAFDSSPTREVGELCRGVDLLIHDGQHRDAEFPTTAYLGHTTVERAVRLAASVEVRRLVVFHHDPARTDDELDEIGRSLPGWAVVARQGETLTLADAVAIREGHSLSPQ